MILRRVVPVQAESQERVHTKRAIESCSELTSLGAHILAFLRFGAVPADAAEVDAFISDLYVHLVEEAAVVLNHRIK